MSVVTSLEETGPCRKKLTFEIPAEAVEAEMGRVVGSFRQKVRMPGFRRGKVPDTVVRKRFREEIRQEVIDRLLPRYLHQAQAEKNLEPLLPPQVEDLEIEDGKPMTVVASLEIRPEIQLADYRDFDLPQTDVEPKPGEIEEALNDLRRHHATWVPVERASGRGDLVSATVVDAETGEPAADGPIHVELGAQGVDEELTVALTGLVAGQGAEYRPGAGGEAPRQLRVEVLAVKEQELPELDDALAAKVGLETADQLREAVVANLRRSKEQALRHQRQRAMLEQLRRRHPLELPAGVVQRERERMLQEYGEQLHARGVDVESAKIDWEALAAQLEPEAERRVHERLLLDAIGAACDLRLDESEFERVLASIAARQQQSSLAVRQQLAESGRLEGLRAEMLRQRTIRFLLGEDPPGDDTAGDSEDAVTEDSASTDSENGP